MARPPVQRSAGNAMLRPVASPVDTFVDPGPSRLRGLADALGKIDKPLKEFLSQRDEQQAEADRIRGEAAFIEANGEGYEEAVRQGLIPAQASPRFVKAYKRAQGNLAGQQMRDAFGQAYEAWEGKYQEGADFDGFLSTFLKDNLGTDDPDVLAGVLPHVRELQQNGTTAWIADRHKQTYEGSLNANVAGANRDIETANKDGLASASGTDYPAVFAAIDQKRQAFVSSGGRPEDFDKAMIDAMSAKVLALRDPGLLAWFDQTIPGKDYTYGEDAYGAIVKKNTVDALEVIARRQVSEDAAKQKAADDAAKDNAHRQAVEILSANPAAPIPDGLLEAGMKVDPTFRVRIEEWRSNLGRGFSDPQRVQQVYAEILEGQRSPNAIIQEAFSAGVFGRPEDLTAAYNFAKGFEDNKSRIGETLGGTVAKSLAEAIEVRTKGRNQLGDPISGISNEGAEAIFDFRRLVTDWVLNNPNADSLATEEAVNKIGKLVLDRISGGDLGLPGEAPGQYDRPPELDASFNNPYSSGTAPLPQQQPSTAPVEQQGSIPAQPSAETAGEVEDFLNGLEAEQLQVLDEQAAARGVAREDIVREMLGSTQQPEGGAAQEDADTPTPWIDLPGFKIGPYVGPGSKWYQKSSADGTDLPVQAAAYMPGGGGRGLAALAPNGLVASSARGYDPDLKNLKPAIKQGVTALQATWGKALPIVSGYRSPSRNERGGGAKHSQHTKGNAVDIDVSGMPYEERLALISMASKQGFTGIGVYANSIHLDYGGRRAWGPTHTAASVPSWAAGVIDEHVNRQDVERPKGTPPGIDRDTAMALIDEAMVELPLDTEWNGSASIAGDPTATRLANLIKQHEAAGNYNAVYGNTRSKRDLGQLTVNQILALQVAARSRGAKSTAIGGYQFLYKTLRGLKGELGLTGKERFTPELQDRMFMALLNRRGYREFQAGKISKRQFALRLSQEWASLPNPSTGRSYYDGDGLNRAGTTTAQVYSAMGFI